MVGRASLDPPYDSDFCHSSDCAGGKLGAFVLPVGLGSAARAAAAAPTVTTAELGLGLAGDPVDFG